MITIWCIDLIGENRKLQECPLLDLKKISPFEKCLQLERYYAEHKIAMMRNSESW